MIINHDGNNAIDNNTGELNINTSVNGKVGAGSASSEVSMSNNIAVNGNAGEGGATVNEMLHL